MLAPNQHIEVDALREAVGSQYGRQPGRTVFQPLGLDSWCYRWGDLWISVRRDLLGHVPAAYASAAHLRDAGLDFVLAPLAGADGRVVRTVSGLPVVVYPFLPVEHLTGGPTPNETRRIGAMLHALHSQSIVTELPVEDFSLPFDRLLLTTLDRARSLTGQDLVFADRLGRLVSRHHGRVMELRAEAAELARGFDSRGFVITHGDLNAENVLRHGRELLLADWGNAAVAPPERDGFHLARVFGIPIEGDPRMLRFYDLWWQLSEIADYADTLSRARRDDVDARYAWTALLEFLPD